MKYINEFKESDAIRGIYFCKNKQEATTRNGRPYITVTLQDKTGAIEGKIWEPNSPRIQTFEKMDYIDISGNVSCYNGELQVLIQGLKPALEGEYNIADYMPTTTKDIPKMYQELCRYLGSVKNPHLLELCNQYFLKNKEFAASFQMNSGAKSVHHGFVGGLLEHTLNVVRLCNCFCQTYPDLNRDLLLTAAAFHDVGKMRELSPFPENDYTDEGQLLGHVYMGTEFVTDATRKIEGFPKALAKELCHCFLAHHGELEFGYPKKPATLEALALHYADLADSKLETVREALLNVKPDEEWTAYNRFLDGRFKKSYTVDAQFSR